MGWGTDGEFPVMISQHSSVEGYVFFFFFGGLSAVLLIIVKALLCMSKHIFTYLTILKLKKHRREYTVKSPSFPPGSALPRGNC